MVRLAIDHFSVLLHDSAAEMVKHRSDFNSTRKVLFYNATPDVVEIASKNQTQCCTKKCNAALPISAARLVPISAARLVLITAARLIPISAARLALISAARLALISAANQCCKAGTDQCCKTGTNQ